MLVSVYNTRPDCGMEAEPLQTFDDICVENDRMNALLASGDGGEADLVNEAEEADDTQTEESVDLHLSDDEEYECLNEGVRELQALIDMD